MPQSPHFSLESETSVSTIWETFENQYIVFHLCFVSVIYCLQIICISNTLKHSVVYSTRHSFCSCTWGLLDSSADRWPVHASALRRSDRRGLARRAWAGTAHLCSIGTLVLQQAGSDLCSWWRSSVRRENTST